MATPRRGRTLAGVESGKATSPLPARFDAIKVIGLGGIGVPIAQALVQFLAWRPLCSAVWLVDGDTYEEKNRERVVFDEYENKAVVKARELAHTARGRVSVVPVGEYVTPRSVGRLISDGDVVFLAVDNHATRAGEPPLPAHGAGDGDLRRQ